MPYQNRGNLKFYRQQQTHHLNNYNTDDYPKKPRQSRFHLEYENNSFFLTRKIVNTKITLIRTRNLQNKMFRNPISDATLNFDNHDPKMNSQTRVFYTTIHIETFN